MRSGFIVIAFACALTFHTALTRANDCGWRGTQGDDLWSNPGNWNPSHTVDDGWDSMYVYANPGISTHCVLDDSIYDEHVGTLMVGGFWIEGITPMTGMELEIAGNIQLLGDFIVHAGTDSGNTENNNNYGFSTVYITEDVFLPWTDLYVYGTYFAPSESLWQSRIHQSGYDPGVVADTVYLFGGAYYLESGGMMSLAVRFRDDALPWKSLFQQDGGDHETGYLDMFLGGEYILNDGGLAIYGTGPHNRSMNLDSGVFDQEGGILYAEGLVYNRNQAIFGGAGSANLASVYSTGRLSLRNLIEITDCRPLTIQDPQTFPSVSLYLGGRYNTDGESVAIQFDGGQSYRDGVHERHVLQIDTYSDPDYINLGTTTFFFDTADSILKCPTESQSRRL